MSAFDRVTGRMVSSFNRQRDFLQVCLPGIEISYTVYGVLAYKYPRYKVYKPSGWEGICIGLVM